MTHNFNGSGIHARPPISNISVNKFNVVFEDGSNKKRANFKNASETKKFIDWLLTI